MGRERVRKVPGTPGSFTGPGYRRHRCPADATESVRLSSKLAATDRPANWRRLRISTPEQAAAVATPADAAVVGSAIMRLVDQYRGGSSIAEVGAFIRRLKDAVQAARGVTRATGRLAPHGR
jgi:hypothetical protein